MLNSLPFIPLKCSALRGVAGSKGLGLAMRSGPKVGFVLFTAPMVRSILAGSKFQTRRKLKIQPLAQSSAKLTWGCRSQGESRVVEMADPETFMAFAAQNSPYGQAGDLLQVKESAWLWCHKKADGLTVTGRPKWRYIPVGQHIVYSAEHPEKPLSCIDTNPEHIWRLKVGRFLPRWAIRIVLELTDVCVQRVQSITKADALAEGLVDLGVEGARWHWDQKVTQGFETPEQAYRALWARINGSDSWDANDYVWVISFKRI